MAEEEIAKHTKKLYKFWSSKEHSLWHKIKEFLVGIFIILFSIVEDLKALRHLARSAALAK